MADLVNSKINDEIDLRELFKTLWAYKLFIASTCALGIILSGYYMLNTDKIFSSSTIFKLDNKQSSHLSLSDEFSSIASLAGFGAGSNTSTLPVDEVTGRVFIQRLDSKLNFQADPHFNKYNPNLVDPLWKSLIKRAIGWQKPFINAQEAIWQSIVTEYSKNVVIEKTKDGSLEIVATHVNP